MKMGYKTGWMEPQVEGLKCVSGTLMKEVEGVGMRAKGVGQSLTLFFCAPLSNWPAELPLSPHCLGDQRTHKGLIRVTECC